MRGQQAPKAHWYRCGNCGTMMHTPWKATYGDPYRCVLCLGFMRHLHLGPIPREQAGRGVVWNPHAHVQQKDGTS